MYAATLEPLLQECNQAVAMAKAGAIDDARVCLDRIRFLRSMLAQRSNDAFTASSVQRELDQHPELLRSYVEVATSVNERLALLHQWITESRASFSTSELRQSDAGMSLFIDDALPGIWDFKQDIAIVTDIDGEVIRRVLRARGHKKFVWITESVERAQALYAEGSEDSDTLFVSAGSFPERSELEAILHGVSVPRAALITTEASSDDEKNFYTVARAIGAAVIAGATTQWLPQMTSEQWIALLPKLSNLPSVMSIKSEFEGANVLVVSPGPSLEQDLALLSSVQDRFLIVASVKTLSALFDMDIKPDLAIWQDPRDHSEAIPNRPEIAGVGLVLNESCHPAFYEAPFATHFPYPDPGFLGSDISKALHGESACQFSGTSVSTLSVVMALEFGAKSVTLLGQDLSVAGGHYVSGGVQTNSSHIAQGDYLTCRGIDGVQLPTLPNYYSFIAEFQNLARHFSPTATLINSTARGAYLEGWNHIPFSKHPIVLGASEETVPEKPNIGEHYGLACVDRRSELSTALRATVSFLDHAAKICDEIQRECLEKIQSGSNDCTVIDLLEKRLQIIMDEECPLLRYYTSRQSMALTAATESVENLEQNLRISADYYDAVAQSARHLVTLCDESNRLIEGAQDGAKA